MRVGFDAVTAAPGPHVDVACGYIGGDTPHIWTTDEWNSRPERWRLPIFVRDGGGDPRADANWAKGWALAHKQPAGSVIALDFEQRVDAGYVHTFEFNVQPYTVILYGAQSAVFGNPKPGGGYWVAAWNNSPTLQPRWDAHQYASNNDYDLSVFSDLVRLWDMHAAPPTPAPPPFRPSGGQEDRSKMAIITRPGPGQRALDAVIIGADGNVYGTWATDAIALQRATWLNLGSPFGAKSVSGAWTTDGQQLVLTCHSSDNHMYIKYWDHEFGWSAQWAKQESAVLAA